MVADFPADGVDAVLLTRQHDDPSHPFIHPQVQRILLGAAAFGESYGVEREPPPGVHVGGMQAYIAQRADITQRCRPPILGPLPRRPCQIMPRSGPGASIPIVVNAVEWYTVPGVWIACPNPTWASRQNRCNGLFYVPRYRRSGQRSRRRPRLPATPTGSGFVAPGNGP